MQMAGLMGVGKSTLAQAIGQRTGAVVLDLDVVKSAALDAGADRETAGQVAYEVLRSLAGSFLKQGRSVILDSPCFSPDVLEKGLALARSGDATYAYIECVLPDGVEHRRRLHARPRRRSQGPDFGVPPPDGPPPAPGVAPGVIPTREGFFPASPWRRIDMRQSLDQCLTEAIAYLAELAEP